MLCDTYSWSKDSFFFLHIFGKPVAFFTGLSLFHVRATQFVVVEAAIAWSARGSDRSISEKAREKERRRKKRTAPTSEGKGGNHGATAFCERGGWAVLDSPSSLFLCFLLSSLFECLTKNTLYTLKYSKQVKNNMSQTSKLEKQSKHTLSKYLCRRVVIWYVMESICTFGYI